MYTTGGFASGAQVGGGTVVGSNGGSVQYIGGQGASMAGGAVGSVGGGGAVGYQGQAARGGAAMVTGPAGNSAVVAGSQSVGVGGSAIYSGIGGGGPGGGSAGCCGANGCGTACGPNGAAAFGCGTSGSTIGQLEFVGSGRGSYTTEKQYRYVGTGCGEFDYVKPTPNYCVCIASSSVLLILLGSLLFFLLKDQTNTTTIGGCAGCLAKCSYVLSNNCNDMITRGAGEPIFTSTTGPCSQKAILKACTMCASFGLACQAGPVPSGPAKTCVVWGDPHILTFDNKRVDFYTGGEYWIVKSTTVQIQGQYKPTHATNGLSVMKAIAFGGPFMGSHKLVIGAEFVATFDSQPILVQFPSQWQSPDGKMQAQYNGQGATMQDGREGKSLHVVHLSLPLGVNVMVNRWMEASEGNYINAKITMSAQPQQDGHCGNFNGNQADDDRLQIRQRIGTTGVAADELFFSGPKTSINPSNRPDINDCARPKLEDAKTRCKAKEHKFIPSMSCLTDVCFGGAGFAAEAGATGM